MSNPISRVTKGVMVLPQEIWDVIAKHLPFLDLLHLKNCCKRFERQFSARVQSHEKYLRNHFSEVTSRHGSETRKDSSNIGVALELMLARELHPSMVQVILCEEIAWGRQERDYAWGASVASLERGAVLRRCISSSLWIPEHEHAAIFQAIAINDEEAALCLLLPSLVNLRAIRIFTYAPRVHAFIARIAKNSATQVLPSLE